MSAENVQGLSASEAPLPGSQVASAQPTGADIPFNKPFIFGQELYYVAQCVLSGHTSGGGSFSQKCERLMQEQFDAHRVLMTTSCTAALEIAAILLDLEKDDEVILPSYTFVSTANAFYLRKARLRFIDVRPDTLNLDERLIEDALTERTRAIVPVHYAGVSCEMEAISAIAKRHGLKVVEDAAQGVNARYHGQYEGTLGDLAAYSFHETKNFICGEGGALVVQDPELAERAEIVRDDGTNRQQFFRGEVDAYRWIDTGSSYALPDLLSAFLYAQLENMTEITSKRGELWELYSHSLKPLASRGLLELPVVPTGCETNFHMFQILLESLERRTGLIEHLKARGIIAVFHYVPLHTSPMGERLGYRRGMLPVTEDRADRLVRLPLYYELTETQVMVVVTAIYEFFGVRRPG